MVKHEIKPCPRCGKIFECKAGSVTLCQCFDIKLTHEQVQHIKTLYQDCLCADCLRDISTIPPQHSS